jgi:hypothetical protein
MKPYLKSLIFLFVVSLNLSCGKDKEAVIDTKLTGCPVNSNCTYNFANSADFQEPNKIVSGNNRVFSYNSTTTNLCSISTQFYFKTPLNNADFIISNSEIAAGGAYYTFMCPCCDYISLKPIGGEIKGRMINGKKWLVNASVILGNVQSTVVDTIKINQYFTVK